MIRKTLLLLMILFAASEAGAQTDDVQTAIPLGSQQKFRPFCTVGAGMNWAVINYRKEVRGIYKPGINANFTWYSSPWFALSADYNWFFLHNSSPAFEKISSWNADLNGNLIMDVGQTNLKFRAIFGINYLNWIGTFVGPTLNDKSAYYYGMPLKQEWLAANLGCGISHNLSRNFIVNFDFRSRFTSEKRDLFGVSDTAFTLGCAWHIRGHAEVETDENYSAKRKTTKGRSGRQYKWLNKRR